MVRRFPLVAYFVLAYALTWWVYPLLRFNPLIGLFGLFGPALAAIIVTAVTEGRPGVRALLGRIVRWRVPVPWYLVALGLPAVLSLLAASLSAWLGPAILRVGSCRCWTSSWSSWSSVRNWAGAATHCRS